MSEDTAQNRQADEQKEKRVPNVMYEVNFTFCYNALLQHDQVVYMMNQFDKLKKLGMKIARKTPIGAPNEARWDPHVEVTSMDTEPSGDVQRLNKIGFTLTPEEQEPAIGEIIPEEEVEFCE